MNAIAKFVMIGIAGVSLGFVGGMFTGGIEGMMLGLFSGIIILVPLMQMVTTAKFKGFLPLYQNLEENQKFVHFPDSFGRIKTIIMNKKRPGTLYKKGLGWVDDKGSEYAWGNSVCSFALPFLGITIDWKNAQYAHRLKTEKGIGDYDDGLKTHLGLGDYLKIKKKTTGKNPTPDIDNINSEIQMSIDTPAENPLKVDMIGETVDFKDFLMFLKYAYSPVAMENAIETEKIWVKREQMGYKDTDKAVSRAKAVIYILFGLMIFIAVVSSLDLSFFGNLF